MAKMKQLVPMCEQRMEMINCNDFMAVGIGDRGIGKTECAITDFIKKASCRRFYSGVIFRGSEKSLVELARASKRVFSTIGAKAGYSAQHKTWELENGSTLMFASLDDMGFDRFDGQLFNYMCFDNLGGFRISVQRF